MNFIESFKQALDSLRSNKLRSFLTMLGIVMGVFSVITIVAIGNAAQAYMNAQFEKLGANVIQISQTGKSINPNDRLTLDDLETIKKAVPDIKDIHSTIQQFGEVRVGKKTKDSIIIGLFPQSRNFMTVEMAAGRFVTDADISARSNVVIVDEGFARKFFNRTDVTGETLQMRTQGGTLVKLKIVGVTKSEGSFFEGLFGDEYPATVYLPITTVQGIYNIKTIGSIDVSVVENDKLQDIGIRIVRALEFKHKNKGMYSAWNSADMQKSLSGILGVISSVLLVIAVITLIVGGIGIVNILLVSVTERIREIGIRKALGAQKKDIVLQFLTESIMMTGISGLIGIALGIVAGGVIATLIKIPPTVDFVVVVLSFLGSVVLGLIFGVYPAKRAADLDPIESLRYE